MIRFNGFKNINITNFHVDSKNSVKKGISFFNDLQDVNVNIINSSLDINHLFKFDLNSKPIYINIDNAALNKLSDNITSAFNDYPNSYLEVDSITTDKIQENFNMDSIPGDVTTSGSINYLGTRWGAITLSGNTNYKTIGHEWYNGKRDGISPLYFPKPYAILSSNTTSGSAPLTVNFAISATSGDSNNSNIDYIFGDGNTSATTSLNVSHIYSGVNNYDSYAVVRSKNKWYTVKSNEITISAFAPSLSANFNIYDKSTSGIITSSYTYTDIFISGNVVSGNPDKYDVNFEDEIAQNQSILNNVFVYDYQYKTPGSKTVILTIKDNNKTATSNINFTVEDLSSSIYYVNINSAYDSSETHTGTSANPFNYNEFYNYIKTSGTANTTDEFKLQGYRILSKPTSASSPWTAIETDPNKRLTINAWDLNTYGPWMLIVEDYDLTNNSIMNFKSSILKNGIIYNKPFTNGNVDNGGIIYISYLYNMFIVNQANTIGSGITIYPENIISGSNIFGSTVYSYTGFTDETTFSAYNLNVVDSVIVGFKDKLLDSRSSVSFDKAILKLFNNAFDVSLSRINGNFANVLSAIDNQYSWTIPNDYPFLKGNKGYNKTLNWLLSNKEILNPFDNINVPPNPGKNYDVYRNYDTGIFGVVRKDYRR